MTSIQVFDPSLCCSSGVCGVDVDQQLVDFAANVDWAKQNGVNIERFNLAQQPIAFAENPIVKTFLENSGAEGLPLTLVDGALVVTGRYPSRSELMRWLHIDALTEQNAELIAIGAAIATGCEPCFKFHYDKARKLGVANETMMEAVNIGYRVKQAAGKNMLALADRILGSEPAEKATSSCCGGPATDRPNNDASGCCG
jgi:AhpD family alkylhydroperoxidase